MSLEECVRDDEMESRRAAATGKVVPWVILVVAAVILLETFGHPLLAASALCLKFALDDFLTAFWLLRRDPVRHRAWATGLLYAATGFWKAAVVNYGVFTALIGYTLLSGVPAWPQRQPNAPPADFIDDPLTPWAAPTVFGHAVEFFLGMAAVWVAYAYHQKLWLSPRIHLARRLREWPPTDDKGVNWLAWAPALSAAAVPIAIWLPGVILLALIPPPPAVDLRDWEPVPILHSAFAFFLTLPAVLVSAVLQDKRNRYLLAHYAEECWEERDAA